MSDSFLELDTEDISYCIECGKKIKSGHYFSGRGPYGICCYKKLYGNVGLMVKRRRNSISKKRTITHKGETCPVTGTNKECEKCLFFDDCNYK